MGGGYIGPESCRTTNIHGYSFTMYPGNHHNATYYGDALHLGTSAGEQVYLYHGIYGNTYGIFYLLRYYTGDLGKVFMRIYDKELGEYTATLTGVTISPSPNYLSDLINSPATAQYFDVIPSSWLLYINSHVTNYKYNLCFISQSDLEEWLNTYWKYEPNK